MPTRSRIVMNEWLTQSKIAGKGFAALDPIIVPQQVKYGISNFTKQQLIDAINKVASDTIATIKSGRSVLIFPEGTRNSEKRIKRYAPLIKSIIRLMRQEQLDDIPIIVGAQNFNDVLPIKFDLPTIIKPSTRLHKGQVKIIFRQAGLSSEIYHQAKFGTGYLYDEMSGLYAKTHK